MVKERFFVIAPQSIELSALRNTFYSKKEIIYIYTRLPGVSLLHVNAEGGVACLTGVLYL